MTTANASAEQPDVDINGVPVFYVNRILRIDGMGPCAQFVLSADRDGTADYSSPLVIVIWPVEKLPMIVAMLGQWLMSRAAKLVCETYEGLRH